MIPEVRVFVLYAGGAVVEAGHDFGSALPDVLWIAFFHEGESRNEANQKGALENRRGKPTAGASAPGTWYLQSG